MFNTNSTVGNMNAIRCPARNEVSVRSSFASPKRATSWRSRTKARTTRMPVICSRSTWFTRSMRTCICANCGTMRTTIAPMLITSAGTLTSSSSDSGPSSRTAMITPPTIMIGAATSRVHPMSTSIWTCCTSLVMRVMSDGAPKWATSSVEKSMTRWNRSPRTSRPKAIAALDPK